PDCPPAEECQVAKIVSLVVKFGALAFAIGLKTQYAINLQLLGGILIIQTLPSVILGLYTRWLNPYALLVGWLAGIGSGIATWVSVGFKTTYVLTLFGTDVPCYAALASLVLNLAVSAVLSLAFNVVMRPKPDATIAADYA